MIYELFSQFSARSLLLELLLQLHVGGNPSNKLFHYMLLQRAQHDVLKKLCKGSAKFSTRQ